MDPIAQLSGAAVPAGFDAEQAINMEEMEQQFAVKAVQQMQTYWSLLETVKGSTLRLTKMDDDIYAHLTEAFPDFDAAATINEDEMKSKAGKERWRAFMMVYEKKIDDYNFGTMVRDSPRAEYEEKTTIFVPRMQFYAIEIARNKKALNDWIYEKAQAENDYPHQHPRNDGQRRMLPKRAPTLTRPRFASMVPIRRGKPPPNMLRQKFCDARADDAYVPYASAR
ncbi:hypothetical protein XA68_12525 [Ophiocordyceps unilateralis]|uniref:Protein PBDC1 homolog n=1 Tax=Ophiocordyceps unilateralis TaxID=268505 RepID=A0A2A9PN47_OPHUN|nr:hypothetical protein XA68_12525 [Ophiocordyceps unilateralis]